MRDRSEKVGVEFGGVTEERWRQLLRAFSDSTIYQSWEFGEVRWGRGKLRHVIMSEGGRNVAIAQIAILKMPIIGMGVAYVSQGPVWQDRETGRSENHFRRIIRAIREEFGENQKLVVRIRPPGFEEYHKDTKKVLEDEGFKPVKGSIGKKGQTILVDLSCSETDLRKRLEKNWRNCLNRAEREGLTITESFEASLFDKIRPLYEDLVKRKQFTGSDMSEWEQIQRQLTASDKMRLTVCEIEKKAIAGSICSGIGDTVIGLVGVTSEEGRKRKAYYLLQWDEIVWSKRQGKRFYDLNGINPAENPGGYHFKSGLKGEEVTDLGVYEYCGSRLTRWLGSKAETAVSKIGKAKLLSLIKKLAC